MMSEFDAVLSVCVCLMLNTVPQFFLLPPIQLMAPFYSTQTSIEAWLTDGTFFFELKNFFHSHFVFIP